jgi:phosphopantothenoylcysteine decarboxylase/phosphopantothenate--cysteine ligase
LVTNKKVLITAGPTWVPIDKARVISNIASGQTGFILAGELKKLGAKVTLLLGPGYFYGHQTGIKIIRFKYFTQLKKLLENELKKGSYSAVIHTAAVSDYQPQGVIRNKVSSQFKNWKINLVPTEKLISSFKDYGSSLFTVGFKFEPTAVENKLLKEAEALRRENNLNLVVANSDKNAGYRAHILDGVNKYGPFLSKQKLAKHLTKLVLKRIP